MGRSSRRRTGGERRGLLVFLSFSFSFSRLFREIFITFFRCRSNQLYSFAETRGKGEKDNNNTTKKQHHAPALSSFVRTIIPFIIFRRHSRYVRTLLLRMKNKRSS